MNIWHKPLIYTFSHIFFGFASYSSRTVLMLVLLYQLGQLFFNVRVFPLAMKIEKGNSLEHTAIKLLEIGLGYLLGRAWHQTKFNFA
jgi:hypothetical protein